MAEHVVRVRFEWGQQDFTFPFEHEAIAFRDAVLMSRECVAARYRKATHDPA